MDPVSVSFASQRKQSNGACSQTGEKRSRLEARPITATLATVGIPKQRGQEGGGGARQASRKGLARAAMGGRAWAGPDTSSTGAFPDQATVSDSPAASASGQPWHQGTAADRRLLLEVGKVGL